MSQVDLSFLSIAFLIGNLGQGGAERQLYYMLRTLRECGATLQVLSLNSGEYWESRIRELDIPVIWIGQSGNRISRLFKIVQVLHQNRPCIVQSQQALTNLYAFMAARLLGLREIGAIRSDVRHEFATLGILGYPSFLLPRFMVANSQSAIQTAIQMGLPSHKAYYLPNVIDTRMFDLEGENSSRPSTNNVTLLAAGHLGQQKGPQKRLDRFIRVLSELQEYASLSVTGLLAGDGELRPVLEAQAKQVNLVPDKLSFLGYISDMRSVYKRADIFVLTSDWEGTPNVILEAMACGLPVVSTNVGGVPEIIQDGITGFLVPPDDNQALLHILLKLITNSDLRVKIGKRAREYIDEHYSLQSLREHMISLYGKVLQ